MFHFVFIYKSPSKSLFIDWFSKCKVLQIANKQGCWLVKQYWYCKTVNDPSSNPNNKIHVYTIILNIRACKDCWVIYVTCCLLYLRCWTNDIINNDRDNKTKNMGKLEAEYWLTFFVCRIRHHSKMLSWKSL